MEASCHPVLSLPTTLGMTISKMSIHVHVTDASTDLFLCQINSYRRAPSICEGSKREVVLQKWSALGRYCPGRSNPSIRKGQNCSSSKLSFLHSSAGRRARGASLPFPRNADPKALLVSVESLHTHLVAKNVSGITGTFCLRTFHLNAGHPEPGHRHKERVPEWFSWQLSLHRVLVWMSTNKRGYL